MNVELLRITEFSEELVSLAYGTCTNKIVPIENIPKYIAMGHLSPIEHASASFLIEGISRACLAQLTRHRLASYSVESMRYCAVGENEMGVPDSIKNTGLLDKYLYLDAIEYARTTYQDLIDSGIPKEDARFVLPLATSTNLIMTANFREWRHILKLRMSKHAQWEIREVANSIYSILVTQAPNVFGDLVNDN